MDLADSVRMLEAIPLFSGLSQSCLKLLAFASDRVAYQDGEIVVKQGDPADCAYLMERGTVEVYAESNGERTKLTELGENDVFGEMALFLASGRSATIVAKGPITVMKLDGEMFLKTVTENPAAALAIMKALSERILTTSRQVTAASG